MKRAVSGLLAVAVVAALALSALRIAFGGSSFSAYPAHALLVVDGEAYGEPDLEVFLGEPARFRSLGEARLAIDTFADHIHETRQRSGPSARPEPAPIDEATLRRRYESERGRFVHPRLVRVAYLKLPKAAVTDARQEIAALRVDAVTAQAMGSWSQLATRTAGSGALVLERGGVPCDASEGSPPLPVEVVAAACEQPVGAVSLPIDAGNSLYLVKKVSEAPARHVPYSRAREVLRQQLAAERRRRPLGRPDVRVFEERLLALVEAPPPDSNPDAGGPPAAPWSKESPDS